MSLSCHSPVVYWKTLEDTRLALGFDDREFASLLGMEVSDYWRARLKREDLSVAAISAVMDEARTSWEKFFAGDLDFDAIRALRAGDFGYLPERYQTAARSKRRTSINLLAYMDHHYGFGASEGVLRHLQIRPEALADPDALTNVYLNADICDYFERRHCGLELAEAMGAYSTVVNRGGPVARAVQGLWSPQGAFETIVLKYTAAYDENYVYELRELNPDRAVVVSRERPDAQEDLKRKLFNNKFSCMARGGVMTGFPALAGFAAAKLKKQTCIYQGDAECVFELSFR